MSPSRFSPLLAPLLAIALLTSCSEPGFGPEAIFATPDPAPICTLDDLVGNPSGLHRSGSVGGVGFASRVGEENVIGVDVLVSTLQSALDLGPGRHDVAVLVVDDYGSAFNGFSRSPGSIPGEPVYEFGSALFDTTFEQIDDLPGNYIDDLTAYLDGLLRGSRISHGALVLNHVIDLLAAFPGVVTMPQGTSQRTDFRRGGARITVAGIEVSGLNTPQIRSVVAAALDAYRAEGFERIVVNLSFVLEPCAAVQRFVQQRFDDRITSFDIFQQTIQPPVGITPPGFGFGQPPALDAFRGFVEEVADSGAETLFVAAAGNNGRPGPQPPSNWRSVLGVSSGEPGSDPGGASLLKSAFSNSGELLARGTWIELTRPGADLTPSDDVVVGGTSLAAPLVTVFSALDLSQQTPTCSVVGIPELSPLAPDGEVIENGNLPLSAAAAGCN